MRLLTLPLFAVSLVITACGGSGSDPVVDNKPSVVIPEQSFDAQLVLGTSCQVEVPVDHKMKAEMLVYNENWQITERIKPSADGKVSWKTPLSKANIGFVWQFFSETEDRLVTEAVVYQNISPQSFGSIKIDWLTTHCECAHSTITAKPTFGVLQKEHYGFVSIEGWNGELAIKRHAQLPEPAATVSICREPGKTWPRISALATLSDGSVVAGSVQPTDISNVKVNLDQQGILYDVNLNKTTEGHYILKATHLGENNDLLHQTAVNSNSINIFPAMAGHKTIKFTASTQYQQPFAEDRTVTVRTYHTQYEAVETLQRPQLQLADHATAKVLINGINNLSQQSGTVLPYSFSTADFQQLSLTTRQTANDKTIRVHFYGALQGTIPMQVFPAEYNTPALNDVSQHKEYYMQSSTPRLIGSKTAKDHDSLTKLTTTQQLAKTPHADLKTLTIDVYNSLFIKP